MAVQSLLTTQSANGYEYQAVTLETVVLEKLVSNDPTELEKLVKAAKSPGFFYLDLNNDEKYLGSLQEIYDSADKYFDQPEDVKMVDFRKDQDSSQDRGLVDSFTKQRLCTNNMQTATSCIRAKQKHLKSLVKKC